MEDFASRTDLNGVGGRVGNLEIACARCQAKTEQRFLSGEMRMDSHKQDITEIKDDVKKINATIYKAMGVVVGISAILQIVIPYVLKGVHP